MAETNEPTKATSLRGPLEVMARVFEREAAAETEPDLIRQNLRMAAECQRDAAKEP